jgi:hypothetical protein
MSTVNFKGQDWPVRFDFSAIKRTLPLFALKYMTDVAKLEAKMAEEFPVDAMAPFIHNVVRSGLRYTGDERECPTLEDIEDAIDDNMGLIGDAVNAIAEKKVEAKGEAIQKTLPAKKKKPTSKP